MIQRASFLGMILILLLSACSSPPDHLMTATPQRWTAYQDGYFQVELPAWPDVRMSDPETILTVGQEGFFVVVNRYQTLPDLVARELIAQLEREEGARLVQESKLEEKPFFEFTTRSNNRTTRLQAVLDYCQGFTYAVIAGGAESVSILPVYQRVLNSAVCLDPVDLPQLTTGKIGLIANPAEDDYRSHYQSGLRLARENGVQVLHSYLQWGDLEISPGSFDLQGMDALMGYQTAEGFEISLVINVIHGSARGPVPEDLQSRDFDDPQFTQRFRDFVLEVLDRYPVRYLTIGNEVNDFFVSHRDQLSAYQTFFSEVYSAVKRHHPDCQVGMTFAFHDPEASEAADLIADLNQGDFVAYTLYPYRPGCILDRNPDELDVYLDQMINAAAGKPIAVVEIGWSTAEGLQGSEDDQALFVREAFQQLEEHREEITFLAWSSLHDREIDSLSHPALRFLPLPPDLISDEIYPPALTDYWNHFGLRRHDGTPKPAWLVFQQETKIYLEKHHREGQP